jgi:hypothetical protein
MMGIGNMDKEISWQLYIIRDLWNLHLTWEMAELLQGTTLF